MVLAAVGIAAVCGAHVVRIVVDAPLYEYWLESTTGTPVFLLLGALILARSPNAVGRTFLIVGLSSATQFASGQIALAAHVAGWPGSEIAALVSGTMQMGTVLGFLLLMFLFPTGSVLSPRWKPWLVVGVVGMLGGLVDTLTSPTSQAETFPGINNPAALDDPGVAVSVVTGISGGMTLVAFVVALISLVVRWRRSHGTERLQLKVFAYGALMGVLLILFGNTFAPASWDAAVGSLVWTIGPLCLPVSAGIAILRHRLYDIDVVVNRTLVYALLTSVLALLYGGSVVALQALIAPFAAESDLAIAGSTLVVAALFRPVRTRVQRFIDHRFYRRKFNAQQTVEEFNSHLRDEVDLSAVTDRLTRVVGDTLQPAHVSVWVRSGS